MDHRIKDLIESQNPNGSQGLRDYIASDINFSNFVPVPMKVLSWSLLSNAQLPLLEVSLIKAAVNAEKVRNSTGCKWTAFKLIFAVMIKWVNRKSEAR